jgi:transcriptional regulator with GAF, ATPase, and Fis domain
MSSDARSEALAALTQFLVTDTSVGDTLLRIAEITINAIPGADVAGITMLDDNGHPTTGVYTDKLSPEVDAAQYSSGRGPCLDAWHTRSVIRIDDHATQTDYPEFSAAARECGVQSSLSLPLVAVDKGIGALNLYSRKPHAFTSDDESLGLDLAAAAAVALANISAYWTAFELGQNLNKAMETRAGIEQAKGMLMAQAPELSPDGAFDLLRRASQRENVKLRDIAERIRNRKPLNSEDD